jgi:hypothetical protein
VNYGFVSLRGAFRHAGTDVSGLTSVSFCVLAERLSLSLISKNIPRNDHATVWQHHEREFATEEMQVLPLFPNLANPRRDGFQLERAIFQCLSRSGT